MLSMKSTSNVFRIPACLLFLLFMVVPNSHFHFLKVTIWDSREGKVVTQLREHSDSVKSVAFHPGTGAWAGKTMLASAGKRLTT